MSITSMVDAAYTRKQDKGASTGAGPVPQDDPGKPTQPGAVSTALGAIVTYFPTEVNVLYAAIIAAISTFPKSPHGHGQLVAFYFMLAATPVIVWLLAAAKAKKDGQKLPIDPRTWPALEIVISMVAFAVWAGALPQFPLKNVGTFTYSPALSSVVLLAATAFLGLMAPVFGGIHIWPAKAPEAMATAHKVVGRENTLMNRGSWLGS